MKISIILPVYNGEKFLVPCLESLAKQTIKDYEVICVNDGSKDKSGEILDRYSRLYPNIFKIFHRENHGVYKTREYAIQQAQGEYIGFCDCDDIVADNMYELLYNCAIQSNAEMAVCAYKRVDAVTGKTLCSEMNQFGNQVLAVDANKDKLAVINTALWNKIIRCDIAEKHISFNKAPRIAEDMMFLLSIYPYMKRIVFCEDALYYYYVREGSAMSSVKQEEISNLKACMEYTKAQVENTAKDWQHVVNLCAFIHFGIALVLKATKTPKEILVLQKDIEAWLNENFKEWKHNPYLRFKYIVRGKGYLFKPAFVLLMYKMKLFMLFLVFYTWITETLKIDIKW